MDHGKRATLTKLSTGIAALRLSSAVGWASAQTDTDERARRSIEDLRRALEGNGVSNDASESERLERAKENMRRAEQEDAKEVEKLYSTKPVRVLLKGHEYLIPANYFGPKQLHEPDLYDAKDYGVGFFLFLPTYGGYTKENWRDPFDLNQITVARIRPVDKNATVPYADGHREQVKPAEYGEPRAQFENFKDFLEAKPSLKEYGLVGYVSKIPNMGVFWTGMRSNGEFVYFRSSLVPGKSEGPGIIYPQCDVRYYSEKEDLYISYRYSQRHFSKWRDIDDAIWAKFHGWRIK